jgi:outer membrane cobalamin receptor
MKITPTLIVLLFAVFVHSGCSTSEYSTSSNAADIIEPYEVNDVNSSISLLKQIRRLPGVYIERNGGQTDVYLKGGFSFAAETRVLFVVNNIPVGNDFSEIDGLVNVNDIKNIKVMRSFQSSQLFGMRGAYGAIVFETR